MNRFLQSMLSIAALCFSFAAMANVAPTVTPANLAEVEQLSAITITYPDADISDIVIADPALINFINNETGDTYTFSVNPPLRRPEITIQLDNTITTPGTYGLFVGRGAFLIAGEENSEIDVAYTVVEPSVEPDPTPDPDPDPTPGGFDPYKVMSVDPAPGVVTQLSEWTILFDCAWVLDDRTAKITLSCTNPDVVLPAVKTRGNIVYLDGDAEITTPGTYTLTISAGRFLLGPEGNGVPNPIMTYEYVIEEGSVPVTPYSGTVTVDPTEGLYEKITSFRLTFESETEIADASKISVYDANDLIAIAATTQGNTLTVDIKNASKSLSTPGEYYLLIERGALNIGGQENQWMEYKYYIGKPGWKGGYSSYPEDGDIVESLKNINIYFSGANNVVLNMKAAPAEFPQLLNDATGALVSGSSGFASGNTLFISLSTEVTTPGTYLLIVPPAFITIDGEHMTDDLKLIFKIEGAVDTHDFTYTITPANGQMLGMTESISVAFAGDGLESVDYNSFAWGNKLPHFTSDSGAYCPNMRISRIDDVSFLLSHDWPFEDSGEFKFVIPAEYFTLSFNNGSTVTNGEIVTVYKVGTSAIGSITADSRISGNVYNTLGMLIIANASVSQIQGLPAGLYIIGGKKVIVK